MVLSLALYPVSPASFILLHCRILGSLKLFTLDCFQMGSWQVCSVDRSSSKQLYLGALTWATREGRVLQEEKCHHYVIITQPRILWLCKKMFCIGVACLCGKEAVISIFIIITVTQPCRWRSHVQVLMQYTWWACNSSQDILIHQQHPCLSLTLACHWPNLCQSWPMTYAWDSISFNTVPLTKIGRQENKAYTTFNVSDM